MAAAAFDAAAGVVDPAAADDPVLPEGGVDPTLGFSEAPDAGAEPGPAEGSPEAGTPVCDDPEPDEDPDDPEGDAAPEAGIEPEDVGDPLSGPVVEGARLVCALDGSGAACVVDGATVDEDGSEPG